MCREYGADLCGDSPIPAGTTVADETAPLTAPVRLRAAPDGAAYRRDPPLERPALRLPPFRHKPPQQHTPLGAGPPFVIRARWEVEPERFVIHSLLRETHR